MMTEIELRDRRKRKSRTNRIYYFQNRNEKNNTLRALLDAEWV